MCLEINKQYRMRLRVLKLVELSTILGKLYDIGLPVGRQAPTLLE